MTDNNVNPIHAPEKEQLEGINRLEVKKRAITAGLVVELDPDEADQLGVQGMEIVDPSDDALEQDLLESRFDNCEFDLKSFVITPDYLLKTK